MKNPKASERRVRGFALVPALFLIVVVSLLAVIAVRITTAQQETVVLGLQQARALAAARAGVDWAAYNALNGNCAGGTLNLSAASLAGYAVIVTCAATFYSDGNGSFQAYSITATATFGNYGSADFARRVMRATFTNET
jgi:MSHA biogenesis protein MshP